MENNKKDRKDRKDSNIKRYVAVALICLAVLLGIQLLYMITSYVPDIKDEDVKVTTDSLSAELTGYTSEVANTCANKVENSTLLSDLDIESYKTVLESSIQENLVIGYKIGNTDKKNSLAVVTFDVHSLNLTGYSDKVSEAVKNDIKDFINDDILSKTSSISQGDNSGENLEDSAALDVVGENFEIESELNTNKYLEEPLKAPEDFGVKRITYDVRFEYDEGTKAWVVNSEDYSVLLEQCKNLISYDLFSEADKLVVITNGLSVYDILTSDEYIQIINDFVNEKLETVKDIDYSQFIEDYLGDIKDSVSDITDSIENSDGET